LYHYAQVGKIKLKHIVQEKITWSNYWED